MEERDSTTTLMRQEGAEVTGAEAGESSSDYRKIPYKDPWGAGGEGSDITVHELLCSIR